MTGPVAVRSYNSIYDEDPARYDALRFCWLNQRRARFVETWLKQQPAEPVLEIGSGTGVLLGALAAAFPDRQFTGLDPLESYVRFAAGRTAEPNAEFVSGVAEEAERHLHRNDFGVILSNDVLHHCSDLFRVAAQAACVSRPDAQWLLIEPNWLNPYSFARQSLLPGERVFWPSPFLGAAERSGWRLRGKGRLFLVPPFVAHPPDWAKRMEIRLERVPLLAGGVWIHLVKA
jgi:SAM-dependent methyltransferase